MSCLSHNDTHLLEDLCNCLKESLAFCGVIWTFYLALISIFVERFCILLVLFLVFGLYNSCSFLYLILDLCFNCDILSISPVGIYTSHILSTAKRYIKNQNFLHSNRDNNRSKTWNHFISR